MNKPIINIRQKTRQCGNCTACCDGWLKIVIHGQAVYPGKPCPYSTGSSCKIYPDRPEDPCKKFECGWLMENSPLPETWRPDKCGVIVLFSFTTWQGMPVDAVVPAGNDPSLELLEWMRQFAVAKQRPFFWRENGNWSGYGPPAFQQEMLEKAKKGINPLESFRKT